MSAKTVVIAGTCSRDTQKVLMFVYCAHNSAKEYKELCVLVRRFSRFKQVFACVGGKRPVVMFAASVYAFKWFFVEQTGHTVTVSNHLHHFHSELIVVSCDIYCCKDRGKLVLCRCSLVVFGFCQNSKLPKLLVKFFHISGNSGFQLTKVMVFKFLTFWCRCAKKCSSAIDKILAFFKHFLINKEVFLFRPYCGNDSCYVGLAKKLKNSYRLATYRLD